MTKIQKSLILTMIGVAFGIGFHEARRAALLENQARILQLQRESLASQLKESRDGASNAPASPQHGLGQSPGERMELIRLRGEVARLRGASRELAELKTAVASNANDPATVAMVSWVDRVKKLNDKLEQKPERKIPEFQFLSDRDWLDAVGKIGENSTDADFDHAISELRTSAKNEFAGTVQGALRKYADANNGQMPGDMSQLQPYFESPLDDSMLQRYHLGQSGTVAEVVSPQDEPDEAYYQIGLNTINSSSKDEDTLQGAATAYAAANSGQMPGDPSQLLPYVKTPVEQAALKNLMQKPAGR